MAEYKPGSRWQSASGRGEFVVVRPPAGSGELTCGDAAVQPHGSPVAPGQADVPGDATVTGKRYIEAESGIEILCTRSGGALVFGGRSLSPKDAKPLPASD